jgi:hypothetical protein
LSLQEAKEVTNGSYDPLILAPDRASVRLVLAVALLLAQCGIAFWQHLGDTRYFAWAPNDYAVTYDLDVSVDGRRLTREQIADRYRLDLSDRLDREEKRELDLSPRQHFLWEDPPQHLVDRIDRYEETYGSGTADVTLSYQVDGQEKRVRRWPN